MRIRILHPLLPVLFCLTAFSQRGTGPLPRSTPEAEGISSRAVLDFVQAADKSVNTFHSFMIVRHGKVIADGWWSPEPADKAHILNSVSKSFTCTAIGLAIEEGQLKLDDHVLKFFPEDAPANPSDNLRAMTVRDLLTMSGGHDDEPTARNGMPSVRQFLAHPVPHTPGTHFLYNTMGTYVLSSMITKVTGQTVLEYLKPRLFEPLGIKDVRWDISNEGNSLGGYGLYLRTEDMAKFGQLYLQKGRWNGKQLIPSSWIEQATTKQISNEKESHAKIGLDWVEGYGFQFWRCRHNAYRADGAGGQFIVVMPDQDAVVAITADSDNMQAELDAIWDHLLPAFGAQKLPKDAAAEHALSQATAHLVAHPKTQPPASTSAPVTTAIKIDAADTGRIFDGVGAISGGGGNSRLLIDYPAKQRDQILDYLFKPGYGASLQMLKLEIGGDANSTDGSEPSIEHGRGVVNCKAGYEFWLGEQAKLRNPNIKLYGLAWTAPGWIGNGNFWSDDMIDYLKTWLDCAHSHGLKIDYLGGWNERGFNKAWYVKLHAALAAQYATTQIVGDDSGWKVADEMAGDPEFTKAVDIIGVHYSCQGGDGGKANSCHSTQAALDTKKQLWDSESGSQDDNTGTGPLIRAITRGYIDAKMTSLLNWPLIAAITPNLPYSAVGLMVASEPWSGNYSIGQSLWATAQITQFTQPGWQFLDSGSGYLGGNRDNGSYVSLRSPSGGDYTVIVETASAAAPSTATFSVAGDLAKKPVHVWATSVDALDDKTTFVHLTDLNPDSSGHYQFTLDRGYVYTFSTLSTAGKGKAVSPSSDTLKLPYREDFEQYRAGQEARYLSDMQGSYEVQPCAAGRAGKCLQQMADQKPINWQQDSDAFTLLGDPSWTNYTVSVDAELVRAGMVELIGRAGMQRRPQSHQQGYYFQISDTGSWTFFKSMSNGVHTALGQGSTTALGVGSWHRLSLSLNGATITASLDGKQVTKLTDDSYQAGQIGLGITGYDTDQFDNLSITPIGTNIGTQ
jgi:CubicO group peptidase (beta-lactamase class C family)